MKKNLTCLRCSQTMQYLGEQKFQLGQTGWFMGDLPNLLAGAMELEIYCCPDCGKIEFFRPKEQSEYRIAQVECPNCGAMHDIDDPKCPFCKYRPK
ncbi:MAG: hypothetical protein J6K51_06715 [Clostridia bacterium]|nr:hypothetical protein [Clostridia bacterium]